MSDEIGVFAKLDGVRGFRRRFAPLFTKLVQRELRDLPAGPVVEVGSGDGYLAQHLSREVLTRLVFTEPTHLGVKRLRKRRPKAKVRRASADELPFDDGTVAAVIACCVFDVVSDLAKAFSEFARVLQPGGVVVHFLDMATDLHALFRDVVEESELSAVPNVFTDPMAAPWPEDIMLVPKRQLDMVVDVLGSRGRDLAEYRDAFHRSPDDAVGVFSAINESTEARRRLLASFREAMQQASEEQRQALAAFEGRPVSSSFVFHQRLASLAPPGFALETAELRRESGRLPRKRDEPPAYRSIVGYIQSGAFEASGPPDSQEQYVELGVHVFRARHLD
ncbi:MAG: class I SAM-dependent methyltransferase [Myxococcota bacterium]